jgi:hypothetical protein
MNFLAIADYNLIFRIKYVMTKEKGLCDNCIRMSDECWGKKAQEIAQDPNKTAAEKHMKINENRKKARVDGCDRVNKSQLDPDYPGKELL